MIMLIRNLRSAIFVMVLMTIGGTASTGMYELNLYGSSAEFNYFTKTAPEMLKAGGSGSFGACSTANIYNGVSSDGKHGISVCLGDTVSAAIQHVLPEV